MKHTRQQRQQATRTRRVARAGSRIHGTAARPRLAVHRSLNHFSAQLINDVDGLTLVAAHDRELKTKGTPTERAAAVGTLLAEKAVKKSMTKVVFDRRGHQFHGRVKAFADAAREAGLTF